MVFDYKSIRLLYRICILNNAVDAKLEVRSTSEGRLSKCAILDRLNSLSLIDRGHGRPIHKAQVTGSRGNLLTANGKGVGIEYLQRTVL